jgi:hypothetical protein
VLDAKFNCFKQTNVNTFIEIESAFAWPVNSNADLKYFLGTYAVGQ